MEDSLRKELAHKLDSIQAQGNILRQLKASIVELGKLTSKTS